MHDKQKYRRYLKSDRWGLKKICVLSRAQYKCERCGRKGKLEIHHLTYEHIYNEPIEDLQALCPKCHKLADSERGSRAQYDAAFRTYIHKKYGEDAENRSLDEFEDEFNEWLWEQQ